MKDELIRDRLVVGILDQALSERLQMEPDLTLDKAKWMIRQREAVKAQQEILKGKEKEEISLHAVDKYAPRRKLPAIPPHKLSYQNIIHQFFKLAGDVEKAPILAKSVQQDRRFVFAATEKAILETNASQVQWSIPKGI